MQFSCPTVCLSSQAKLVPESARALGDGIVWRHNNTKEETEALLNKVHEYRLGTGLFFQAVWLPGKKKHSSKVLHCSIAVTEEGVCLMNELAEAKSLEALNQGRSPEAQLSWEIVQGLE